MARSCSSRGRTVCGAYAAVAVVGALAVAGCGDDKHFKAVNGQADRLGLSEQCHVGPSG